MVEITEKDNIAIVKISEDMDLYACPEIKKEVFPLLEKGLAGIVVNMKKVNYIDSSGIGFMLAFFSKAKKVELPLYYTDISQNVSRVIELSSLTDFFPMAATESDARDLLK